MNDQLKGDLISFLNTMIDIQLDRDYPNRCIIDRANELINQLQALTTTEQS